jgi:hypothetical protein
MLIQDGVRSCVHTDHQQPLHPAPKAVRNVILSPPANTWNNHKTEDIAYYFTQAMTRISKTLQHKAILLVDSSLLGCYAASNCKDTDVSNKRRAFILRVHSSERRVFWEYLDGVMSHNAQRRPRSGNEQIYDFRN